MLVEVQIIEDHIAVLTLNRPEAANALSTALLDELNHKIEEINYRPAIYCTIITGSGGKAFCAGADLKERREMSEQEVVRAVSNIGQTVTAVEKMNMPVLAALNGVAFGGGLELALACDMRIASQHAHFGLTETSLAIIPGAGGTQRLPRLIGIGKAKEMIFTAKRIDANEALKIGLIEKVTDEHVLQTALSVAKTIVRNGPIALKQAKLAINQGIETDLATGLTIERLCYKQTIPTEDRIEGLVAFQKKRKPKYVGK